MISCHKLLAATGDLGTVAEQIAGPNADVEQARAEARIPWETASPRGCQSCRRRSNQYAVLMKSDVDLSGIHMLPWVRIVFEGSGGRSRREAE